jgi:hypothetical protein
MMQQMLFDFGDDAGPPPKEARADDAGPPPKEARIDEPTPRVLQERS